MLCANMLMPQMLTLPCHHAQNEGQGRAVVQRSPGTSLGLWKTALLKPYTFEYELHLCLVGFPFVWDDYTSTIDT